MKATLSLSALLLAFSIPAALAQTELAIANHTGACQKCSMKEQKILKLQAELAALKGDTSRASESFTEPVPITPVLSESTPSVEVSGQTYTVQPGDNLYKIARNTQCKASAIAAVNGMEMNAIIRPGQTLKLPATATAATPPKAAAVQEAPKPTYKVKEGETYYRISRNLKIPLDELMAANPKAPADRLYTGRVINLPVKGGSPAPAPAPETQEEPPASEQEAVAADTPPATEQTPPASSEQTAEPAQKKIVAVSVEEEISYGDFAAKHGTDTERLNSLNDLNLTSATILAKGSELYVPAKAQTASN